jgi:hypothetical protein
MALGEGALHASNPSPPKTAAAGCADRDEAAARALTTGCGEALAVVALARSDGLFSASATTARS